MNSNTPNLHRALWAFGFFVMLPFLLFALAGVYTTFYNNSRLNYFEQNFAALSHPANSKFVSREKKVGLYGNGNHCDFLLAELRSYTGNPKRIQNLYQGKRVAVPNSTDDGYQEVENGTQPVTIHFLPSPLPANHRWRTGNDWDLSAFAGQKNLYVVYIINSGLNNSWESLCDGRCT